MNCDPRPCAVVALALTSTFLSPSLSAEDISDQYVWDRVLIGGGGYQTGVVTQARTPGAIYVKGDVMGLHVREPGDDRWRQRTWYFTPEQSDGGGTGGLDVDPTDPAIAYTFLGNGGGSTAGIYKTTDYGRTWSQLLNVYEHTNQGDERKWANNVAVDPNNPQVVYFGTRNDGLIRTTDGGDSFDFKPHPDVPENPDKKIDAKTDRANDNPVSGAVGTRNIVIDPAATVENPRRSKTVYLGVYTQGVWRSDDGGQSFSPMPGSPDHPRWMKLGPNGDLYVAANFGEGVWRYDGQWNKVRDSVNALAVDPHDPEGRRLVVATSSKLYRSTDRGQTWQELDEDTGWRTNYPSDWKLRDPLAATAALDFDKAVPGRLYLSDAFGVWVSDNPYATPITWTPMHEGLEGTVSFALSCPPDNGNVAPLYSGGSDANNYVHIDPTKVYPDEKLAPIKAPKEGTIWLAYCSDYDFAMADPNVIYRVVQAHNQRQYVVKTTNGGLQPGDWETIASSHDDSPLPRPLSWNGRTRKLAVSATDPDVVLMAGRGGYGNHYTTDGGKTWTKLEGVIKDNDGFITEGGWRMYGTDKPIAADRANGHFYAYHKKDFYRSEGGAKIGEWKRVFKFPEDRDPRDWKSVSYNLAASPEHAGHLALGLGKTGLWLTRDGGDNWQKHAGVTDCRNAGWGKKAPDAEHATLFIHAEIDGQWGIYRSTDGGETFDRITPEHIRFDRSANLVGDLQTFGTVYFSNAGKGIVYGKLK